MKERPPPDVHYRFGHDPGAPRNARKALEPLLDDADDPIIDSVMLSASELVTNVVTHTNDGGEIRAWDPKPEVPLRIEVEDHDPTVPMVPVDPVEGGRGVGIVDSVSDAWGVESGVDGKVVWAEFDRDKASDKAAQEADEPSS